jgi:hypothetical protein
MPSERTLERAMQDARSGRLAEAIDLRLLLLSHAAQARHKLLELRLTLGRAAAAGVGGRG